MSSQPQCPKCSALLKDDYGMVSCQSCGVFVFVDMDGIAHISSDGPASAGSVATETVAVAPAPEESAPGETVVQHEPSAHGFTFHTTPDLLPLPGADEPPEFQPPPAETASEPHYDDHVAELDAALDPEAPLHQPSGHAEATLISDHPHELASGELDMDALLGFNDPHGSQQSEAPPVEFGTPGDPLGLNEYANSEISQAKDGLLTFKILISGIDTKEMRETLRSALDDQRFAWNPNELMSRISRGVLQIDNVASVKAVILINRIKRMPVKVRWEQYAITNMDTQ